jgi:alkylmercury lyase
MDRHDPPSPVVLDLTGAEHHLTIRGFVALWQGQQPRPADLDADPAAVQALQRRGLIVLDPDGRITGIHGLSATPTAHRISHAGGAIHTWCAYDALGIPAALGIDAQTRTTCPTCGKPLDVAFIAGQPAADPDPRLWLPTAPCEHVLNDLCAHANLYCNQDHLAAAVPDTAVGGSLTAADAAHLGGTTWSAAATALRAA